ncbi:hypothetical protein [Streptomyces sp. NPDC059943]|uniref:hypothetical protein n=1 Tax=Streptomyces sp. NPDC059943 TaxID=3347010 RepID=UPI00364B4D10
MSAFISARVDGAAASDALVLGLVGDPGTGCTTELAALAARRAYGAALAPTVRLCGADPRAGDVSLADALGRALCEASRTVGRPGAGGEDRTGRGAPAARPARWAEQMSGFGVLVAVWLAAETKQWATVVGPSARKALVSIGTPIPMRVKSHGHGSLRPA